MYFSLISNLKLSSIKWRFDNANQILSGDFDYDRYWGMTLNNDKMKSSTFYFYFTKILSTRIMKFRAHKTVW